ncbi:amino acid adenylation domain-containing protein [Actinokineospora sp. NBRC 105648]|uniref:amino acid adenylation domain-containing protein n=1 Tax=Actinokineospora sp. NBRC 105648 TaxID=3032206 RepID=UPI0024A413B2|nr:amino acid adenylation domain-containing protein [Actinokineospora sp. NBRC 105648]GLZ39082.1 thioester reductase [Actinokineospora sp. NBRC 105648]
MPLPRETVARQAGPPGRTLPGLAEASARAHPDRIAVSAPDGELTHRELHARADLVAAALRHAGVGPDVAVPLVADTGLDLVVGLLGILKAGGAYLPVDPAAPTDRIHLLVNDSGAPVALATTATAGLLAHPALLVDALEPVPDTPLARPVQETDLAYVIHTSGSTGVPKGVRVEHRQVVRLFEQTDRWFGFTADDVWTMFHSASFDFSVWEIWGALLHGGRLVLVPHAVSRAPARFHALVAEQGVTILSQTPSAFRQFTAVDDRPLPALRFVVLGGERLDVGLLAPWFDRHGDREPLVVNMFGITEVTVHATHRPMARADLDAPGVSPIGNPLPDLGFHILDPDGVSADEGELYITGPGVARDYLNRPDLTAERFTALPDGQRAYRTGDLVRRANGEYHYLGRADAQLKVRGFRVEPREVEAVLTAHPEVDSCLVTTADHGDGDVRLVAYVVPPPGTAADAGWWERLRLEVTARVNATLPRHLRPSRYLPVEALPLTRNGKLDRRTRAAGAHDGLSATQSAVADIWAEVLDEHGFGPDQDFFDLGGTSLTLLRMVDRVNTRFRVELDLAALVDGITVESLATELDRASTPAPTAKG